MWIVKRINRRRSDNHIHPHFFRIGGEGVTAAGNGAVVMDLEVAAEVMEGAFADQVKMSHAAEVAERVTHAATRPTLWSLYGHRVANDRRSVPLVETTAGDLLGRRFAERATTERRSAPVMVAADARCLLAQAS